jgi:putative membrane protein
MTFSEHDHEQIRRTVTEAERHTRGEIVPMVVERSARYQEARYRAGIGFAFLVLTIFLTMEIHWMGWGWHAANAGWLLLIVLIAYGVGYWSGTLSSVIRLLTSHERMGYKVTLRAHQAFQEHGLHRTELGTGVLILISLLEHRIEILTDGPILERVPRETWNHMLSLIQEGFQKGNPVESLCQAITLCGEVLGEYFPAGPTGPNPNELPNELIPD